MMNEFPWIDFVVFAQPRTGSNWLCSRLDRVPGITMHYELFHEREPFFSADTSDPKIVDINAEERDADVDEFLRLTARHSPSQFVGFKIFPWQNPDLEDRLTKSSARKIVLFRENLLAQYASDLIATATGTYSSDTERGDEHLTNRDLPVFDQSEFEKWKWKREEWFRGIIQRSSDSGGCFLVCYESLALDFVFAAILSFLCFPDALTDDPVEIHKKSGRSVVPSRFRNFSVVEGYLQDNDLMKWWYD